jgi:8-oxo-dGTP diphosphatase
MLGTIRNKLYNYGMSAANTSPLNLFSSPNAGPFLPNLDVRVVIFCLRDDRLQVLLDQGATGQPPAAAPERWRLPGNRVAPQQSLEETATDSLFCLTGQREVYLEQLFTYGEAARHDAGASERLVTVVYFAIIPAQAVYTHGTSMDKDGCRAKWFPIDQLPPLVADHPDILAYALRRLRYKLEYNAVGFQLLPEQFSLSELQKVYEMILGEKLDKRNFRRRILQAGIIEETRHLRSGEGRPARLFRYRPDAVAEVKARRLFP